MGVFLFEMKKTLFEDGKERKAWEFVFMVEWLLLILIFKRCFIFSPFLKSAKSIEG